MALVQVIQCGCGQVFAFYVPKAQLMAALLETHGLPESARQEGVTEEDCMADAQRCDEEDEQNGSIERAMKLHFLVEHRWVDARKTDEVLCPCGKVWRWRDVFSLPDRTERVM